MRVTDVNNFKVASGVFTAGATELYYVTEPSVIYASGTYQMWAHVLHASGASHSDDTIYLTSSDAHTWSQVGNVLSGVYRPFVLYNSGDARPYWLYGVNNIAETKFGLYTSIDGISWSLDTDAVLTTGSSGSWDSAGIANPCIYREGSSWYMFYVGWVSGVANGQVTGLATSSDGRMWGKDPANPVVIPGFVQHQYVTAGGRTLTKIGGQYYYLFHGEFEGTSGTQALSLIWLARTSASATGTTAQLLHGAWELVGNIETPLVTRQFDWEGSGSSDSQVADPFMVDVTGTSLIFYEGIPHQWGTVATQSNFPYRLGLITLSGTTLDQITGDDYTSGTYTYDPSSGKPIVFFIT